MVNILFVSLCCEQDRFNRLIKEIKNPVQSDQKLHSLLIQGMAHSKDDFVHAISALPVNRHNYQPKYTPAELLTKDACSYHHMAAINIPLLNNLVNFLQAFWLVGKLSKNARKESLVVCDILKFSIASGALLACRLFGLPCIGLVTDVPQKRPTQGSLVYRMIDSLRYGQLQAYDSYVFLTEQMNQLINQEAKPYLVIEGAVDQEMGRVENTLEGKASPRICLYSGSIHRVYGIASLVEGFLKADLPNVELWIYGDGDYREALEEICRLHPRVRYFGVVPNSEVVKIQVKATLLINPRPPVGEYTLYSFPSKNMEYLVSGTPVLAAMLPGMPKAYGDYIFELKDCSAQGICQALTDVFSRSDRDLFEKGKKAKEFVLREKNNCFQGQKILRLARQILGRE